ncbi:MotA/TolQ/ExbB proton channel family protein, partial [Thermogutta sp.]
AFPAASQAAEQATGNGSATASLEEADRRAQEALAAAPATQADQPESAPKPGTIPQINVLDLAFRGGVLMIPITLMSILTVIFGLERALGLRRRKVVPAGLIRGLGQLIEEKRGFDPRAAYRLAQHFPSSAANVLKAMLVKVGRPLPEIEQAMKEATEREADRLYSNVRFLTLSAAVTPLLGLLGTVQGMIQAFFVTSHLPTGADRAEMLAQGIYTALVTTFAGLCVAIPASVLAHYFEGRIQKLLRELDESLLGLLPQFERFEGRLRMGREQIPAPDLSATAGLQREAPQPPPPPSPAETGAMP